MTLFEFRKHNNATDATSAIKSVYRDASDVRTYQRWFKTFELDEFDLLDDVRNGKITKFNKDLLLADIDADLQKNYIGFTHKAWNLMVHNTTGFKRTK